MKMARLEKGVRLVLRYYEAFNRQDVASMLALVGEDFLFQPFDSGAESVRGEEALAAYWQAFFADHPAVNLDVEEIFGLGFRCTARWRMDGYSSGMLLHGVDVFRVQDNSLQEQLSYVKRL